VGVCTGELVIGGLDLNAAIQIYGPLAVLVITEGLERQRLQLRLLFGERGRDLPFGAARGCPCRPSALPTDRDRLAPLPGSRSACPPTGVFLPLAEARFGTAFLPGLRDRALAGGMLEAESR
jgi:hypothetical protein